VSVRDVGEVPLHPGFIAERALSMAGGGYRQKFLPMTIEHL
jgi:hypothetical protein